MIETKKQKVGIFLFVAVLTIMIFGIKGMTYSFANEIIEDGIKYSISNGEASIIRYNGNKAELEIPNEIKGYPVTSIGSSAFYDCDSIKSIVIPKSITSIGESAFYYCSNLESIIMSENITSIEGYTFYYCTKLENIVIPNNVTYIGDCAFYGCRNLKNIVIPDSVKSIGYFAFDDCTSLESVTMSRNITSISESTFYGCSNLKNIAIPNGVKSIGCYAFYGCRNLKNIVIPDSVTSMGIGAFYGCTSFTNIVIPKDIEYMEEGLFDSCSNLKDITIPPSVTKIGKRALPLYNNIVIHGEKGSYVQTYASNNNIIFCFIDAIDINTFQIDNISDKMYTGNEIKPKLSMKLGSKTLIENYDYKLFYENNIDTGTATIIVKGMGEYCGTRKVIFKIVNTPINSKYITVLSTSDKVYTGGQIKPKLSIKQGDKTLIEGIDYTLSYSNNKDIGISTIVIKGKGYYCNAKKVTFKIIPKTITKISQTYRSTSKIELSWNKISGASGYRIYRSTSKNGTYTSIASVKGSGTTSYINHSLSNGKIYYYKVRAYKTVNNTNYYGNYSSALATSTTCKTPDISVSSSKTKVAKVSWKKISGASGYRVYRATSKNGKYELVKTITSGSTLNYTDTGLKKGKIYYYKVKAYKTVNGNKVHSSYSSLKYIKVK